ncbi:MAG: hypothetical protein RRY79_05940 [Clostridia bacterium]
MEEKASLKDRLIKKMKSNKKFEIGVYVALILVAVIVYATTLNSRKNSDGTAEVSSISTGLDETSVEARLESVLSKIRGAGTVKVMITYETGTQIVPAMSENKQSSSGGSSNTESESKEPATVSKNGSNEPIVLTEVQPKIRGVIVIAEGASDISVRMDLMKAVETVLGIENSYIEVFEMGFYNNNQ